ncbi:MAG: PqqD family protein [Clostridia bacterium]|nr:PqqD family protein [Clostridia bacterium]
MKIKKGFVIEEVAGSYLACATGKLARSFNGFIRLNESGAFLWKNLSEGDKSEADLVALLIAEYGISEEIAARDVSAFVENVKKSGALED